MSYVAGQQAIPVVAVPVGGGYKRRTYRKPYGKSFKKKYYNLLRKRRTLRNRFVSSFPKGSENSIATFGKTWGDATPSQRAYRSGLGYRGEGDYKDVLRWGSRGVGALAGGAMGLMSGGAMGAAQGAVNGFNSGSSFSKFAGWGDYVSNQIAGGVNSPDQIISVNASDDMTGDIYFSHSEFCGNVSITTSASGVSPFEVVSYPINPGMVATFPFLSQIAQNFTLYDFQGLMFQFRSNSSDSAGANPSLGKVVMCTQYDQQAPAFINAVQMENYDYATSCKPSSTMVHGVETAQKQQFGNLLYVRTGATTRDRTFTDLATFQIATENIQGPLSTSIIIGELWVSYRVKLSRANLYGSLLGANISQDVLFGTTSAGALSATATTSKLTNQIGCTIANVSATSLSISWPSNISLGTYLVIVTFTSSTSYGATQVFMNNGNHVNLTSGAPGQFVMSTGGSLLNAPGVGVAANNSIMSAFWVTVQAPGNAVASIRCNMNAALNAGTFKVWIQQSNQNATLALA